MAKNALKSGQIHPPHGNKIDTVDGIVGTELKRFTSHQESRSAVGVLKKQDSPLR